MSRSGPTFFGGASRASGADYFLGLLDFDARKDSCDVVITGEGSIDEQALPGKLAAAVARRSGTRPIIAVAGRSLLPQGRWSKMSVSRVYALAGYTDRDSLKDPELSAELLRRIGREIGEATSVISYRRWSTVGSMSDWSRGDTWNSQNGSRRLRQRCVNSARLFRPRKQRRTHSSCRSSQRSSATTFSTRWRSCQSSQRM
ncbi:glycerate kinase [Arthrobacter sp. 2RAF6]|uniref:glycerate kinase n=1 Tax=Arthrobacter sp. 2RAF6 TaxID=3233002 RepID=UPI003F909104